MKKVRILSLDGGGIRGVIPAVVLAYIEKSLIEKTNNPNARLADFFDMIVGTSTGGILSCFYLTPNLDKDPASSKYTAKNALEFYSEKGHAIFNQSKRNEYFGLRQLFNATRYKAESLEEIFKSEFGDLKMQQLLKPCLVTTYDIKNKTSHFFSSREDETKRDFYVRDVARSTSAAPTYFSPAYIRNLANNEPMVNIDGGVFANNPTMCAYSEARNTKFPQVDCPSAKDMLILSIGTGAGQFDLPDTENSKKWGVINWAKSMPDIMMDASVDTVDYQIKKMFATLLQKDQFNYKRIDVPVKERASIGYSKDMADASASNIKKLKLAGEVALKDAFKEKKHEHTLDKFIDLLIPHIQEELLA